MRIPWMITANAVRRNEFGIIDVAGVFDHIPVDSFPETVSFVIIAKVVPEPADDISKDLVLQIFRSDGRCVYERQIPNSAPTYQDWLNGAASYTWVHIDMTVHEPDVFHLKYGTPESVLSEEFLRVLLKGAEK